MIRATKEHSASARTGIHKPFGLDLRRLPELAG
jgi:hypothetical protein